MSTLLAIGSIYIFIVMGFIAKKIFKDEVQERTLIVSLSIEKYRKYNKNKCLL